MKHRHTCVQDSVLFFETKKTQIFQHLTFSDTPATPETPYNTHEAKYLPEVFDERAATMEFDGGLARMEAEKQAEEADDIFSGVSGVAGV